MRAYAPDGTLIGRIRVPELVSNLCFGGRARNRLYITAQTSLYAIYLNTHPAGWNAAGLSAESARGRRVVVEPVDDVEDPAVEEFVEPLGDFAAFGANGRRQAASIAARSG